MFGNGVMRAAMIYNVLQLLEMCAEERPQSTALVDENQTVSYEEYLISAKKIGTYLAKNFCQGQIGKPIAVLIDRNVKSIVAFMGVVYSGGFYVPVDMAMPAERVQLILDTLQPIAMLDARSGEGNFQGAVSVESILQNSEADEALLQTIRGQMIDTDPLYAIFTSGSTGVPKGVLVSHRSVLDLVYAFRESFHFDEGSVFGNQAPFDFDVSTKDIYNSLLCGGCVNVIPKKCFVAPKLLGTYLQNSNISVLIWAVSALRIISDYKVFDAIEQVPALRKVMFSGEVMPVKSLNYWMEKLPETSFVNLYGPTEITCNCTYHIVDRQRDYGDKLPIGKAFPNTRVFLRDDKDEMICVPDVIGEICVEGTCLALGYWNNKEKTMEAFRTVSSQGAYQRRMYATGDMGYYDEQGILYFASRRDHQIKHMGHRIELGEIEAALNTISFITIAVCVYAEEQQKIVCFYQAEEECKKQIVAELAKKLPKYMWPNVYCCLDNMPMTKNGKIDRILLKKEWIESHG